MRNVVIKRTGMENFCCFIKPFIIDFTNNEFVLVVGPNGSGKTSSITNSLMYTLYGVTTKGGRGSDVVNNKVKKDCHTFVEFNINNDEFRVDRYCEHSKFGNDVILKKNDIIIKKGHREVVPEIERLLVSQKLFTNTLLFAQKVKAFFTDLNDSEQKEIFRKVLLLDDYVLYQKAALTKSKECEAKINEFDTQIFIKINMIEDNKKQIEVLKNQKENFNKKKLEDIKSLTINLNDYKENLKKSNLYLDSNKFEGLEKTEKDTDEKITILSSEIHNINSKLENSLNELESKKNLKLSELKSSAESQKSKIIEEYNIILEQERSDFNKRKEVLDKEIRFVSDIINDITYKGNSLSKSHQELKSEYKKFSDSILNSQDSKCPTCNQIVSGESKDLLENHIKELEVKEKEMVIELAKLIEERKEKTSYKESLNNELSSLCITNEKEIQKVIDCKRGKIEEIESKLNSANSQVNNQVEIMRTSILNSDSKKEELIKELEYYKSRKVEIKSLINEKNQVLNWLSVLQNNIVKTNEDIKKLEEFTYDESLLKSCFNKEEILSKEIEDLESYKINYEKRLEALNFWKEGFSSAGIPSMLIDEAIPFMNERVSYYLEEISQGRYSVSFDTLKATKAGEFRDKISVNIFDNVTHANSRTKISGGQERIIDIAIILTLSDLQSNVQDMKFNLLLFDEIFDSLDDANVEYVSRMLRIISKKQNKSIFVISHNPIDQFECDKILRF